MDNKTLKVEVVGPVMTNMENPWRTQGDYRQEQEENRERHAMFQEQHKLLLEHHSNLSQQYRQNVLLVRSTILAAVATLIGAAATCFGAYMQYSDIEERSYKSTQQQPDTSTASPPSIPNTFSTQQGQKSNQ